MKSVFTTVQGKYNTAIVYTDKVDETALAQIKAMCNFQPLEKSVIRIMSDVHAGSGCTIGTTMTIVDNVIPAMVGVDIGCGMRVITLAEREIDYARLDDFIHRNIPAGRNLRTVPHALYQQIDLTELYCYDQIRNGIASKSLGTLGGGNHFIEVDRDDDGTLYLVVHSGSRQLGTNVATYYQQAAYDALTNDKAERDAMIAKLRAEGREKEIQTALKNWVKKTTDVPYDLAYAEGELMQQYLHDMAITQRYASLSRQAMTDDILAGMGLHAVDEFETIHNYIDLEHSILRKGAVSAQKGERLLIPLNMRDGALICVGKGNPDWNCSAPHGAGRLLSRKDASHRLSMDEYRREMQGIYTTSVNLSTLDESPMAYKDAYDIMRFIRPTVAIERRIMPTYNFKASGS